MRRRRHGARPTGVTPTRNSPLPFPDTPKKRGFTIGDLKRLLPKPQFQRLRALLSARKFHYTLLGVAFALLLLFSGILAYQYLFSSPHFSVKRLRFSPTLHVEREELIQLAGIKPNTNIFRLSPGAVARRLRAHPWVRRVSVSRVLPDKLHIQITEHEAAGAVLFTGDKSLCTTPGPDCQRTPFYLLNSGGEVFKRAAPEELQGRIIITGLSRARFVADPHGTQRWLKRALELYHLYNRNTARPALSEIFLEGDIVTLFFAATGTALHLNRDRFAALLDVLDTFLGSQNVDLASLSEIYMDNRENEKRVVVIPHPKPKEENPKKPQLAVAKRTVRKTKKRPRLAKKAFRPPSRPPRSASPMRKRGNPLHHKAPPTRTAFTP